MVFVNTSHLIGTILRPRQGSLSDLIKVRYFTQNMDNIHLIKVLEALYWR